MGLTFDFCHAAGACDIKYIARGETEHLLTGGQDATVGIRSLENHQVKELVKELNSEHDDGVNVIAVSPKNDKFATGSSDREVRVFKYPEFALDSDVKIRFTLPVRALAFSADGAALAAGGDDSCVRVVNASDGSHIRTINVEPSCAVRSIAFDPTGEYLAVCTVDGTVNIWSLSTEEHICALKKIAPKVDVIDNLLNRIAWHPDGSLLAIPAEDKGVILYERDCWEAEASRLSPPSLSKVSLFAWSPNGLYAVIADADMNLHLYDMKKQQALDRHKMDCLACGISWHPSANIISIIGDEGAFAVWNDVVPDHLPPPGQPIDEIDNSYFNSEAVEDEPPRRRHPIDNLAEEDDFDSEPARGADDEDDFEAAAAPSPSRPFTNERVRLPEPLEEQPPIHQGATPLTDGASRRFLTYNTIGSITSRKDTEFNVLE
eukprot:gene27769-34289_t